MSNGITDIELREFKEKKKKNMDKINLCLALIRKESGETFHTQFCFDIKFF